MIWSVRKIGTRTRALKWWHEWFAWYPVRVPTKGKRAGMTMAWLITVRRRGRQEPGGLYEPLLWVWQYEWLHDTE